MIEILKTFLLAMVPIGELRASLPIALHVYHMPIWSAFLFSILGNLVPPVLILFLLKKLSMQLKQRHPECRGRGTRGAVAALAVLRWILKNNKKRHSKKVKKWGAWALLILVAIPLPFTGAWTGAFVAFVSGISLKRALPFIFLGVLIAAIIVLLINMPMLY